METIDRAYQIMLWISTIILSLSAFSCLIRAIMGPRLTDRIVSINVICTKVVILIAILSCIFDKGGMLDIAIVYAMISFLAIVVLSKCYLLPHNANPNPDYNPETPRDYKREEPGQTGEVQK